MKMLGNHKYDHMYKALEQAKNELGLQSTVSKLLACNYGLLSTYSLEKYSYWSRKRKCGYV